MKKLMMAGAFALIAAPAAMAMPQTGLVTVNGTAPLNCTMSGFGGNGGSITVGLNQFTAPDGTAPAADTQPLGINCNAPASVTFSSANGFLKLQTSAANAAAYDATNGDSNDFTSAATSQFASGVNYTAEILVGGVSTTPQLKQSSSVPTFVAGNANAGSLGTIVPTSVNNVSVRFETEPSTSVNLLPLIAGTYSDTLTFTVTPQSL